jgi:hypothetical protein
VNRCIPIIVSGLVLLTAAAARASDPQDVGPCETLLGQGRTGLFVKRNEAWERVNGRRLRYDPGDRFYYVTSGADGRPYRVRRETIWNVRTRTLAASAAADETVLWRPRIQTLCSAGQIESFNEYNRFVTLQRYYDHHHRNPSQRRPDGDIAAKFHMPIEDPARPGRCDARTIRTDNPNVVGNLRDTYEFEGVKPDDPAVARLVRPGRALAAGMLYSGLSSELAHAAPGEPACFGFAVPLPTRSTWYTRIFPMSRNTEALTQAQTWQPSLTHVDIQIIPKGGRLPRIDVHWEN